MAPVVYIQ